MPRYRLLVEYDGGPFVGWRRPGGGAAKPGRLPLPAGGRGADA